MSLCVCVHAYSLLDALTIVAHNGGIGRPADQSQICTLHYTMAGSQGNEQKQSTAPAEDTLFVRICLKGRSLLMASSEFGA